MHRTMKQTDWRKENIKKCTIALNDSQRLWENEKQLKKIGMIHSIQMKAFKPWSITEVLLLPLEVARIKK